MRQADGVALTEGKVGSFPSFCSHSSWDMASERESGTHLRPGPHQAAAPSSPLEPVGEQGLTIIVHPPGLFKGFKGAEGSAMVSAQVYTESLGGPRMDRRLRVAFDRALKGLTLCFLEPEMPHNSFQLLPDLWTGLCVLETFQG